MLQVQLLFLLLNYMSVKSQAVFENGITKLPPTYEISHGNFDPFLKKVIRPPSFYLTNDKSEDYNNDPTQSTPFLPSKDQKSEEKYYKNRNNIPEPVTIASSASSEYESPMYIKEVNPLPLHSVQQDHTTQTTFLSTSASSLTSPEDTVLGALFSNHPFTSPSFDTSSEPVSLNALPLSTLSNILYENSFDDIKRNPIGTFPDSSAVLRNSAIPPISFTFTTTFQTPYLTSAEEMVESNLRLISEEENVQSNLRLTRVKEKVKSNLHLISKAEKVESNLPTTTLRTTTCDQDDCFDNNGHASEEPDVATVYPDNYKSSLPTNIVYSYINPMVASKYDTLATYFESFDTTTNPTDLSFKTTSTFLPTLSGTTWVPFKNIDDPLNLQKESIATSNPEETIGYSEEYSYSNIGKVQDVYRERNDSFNGEPIQSEHPDIGASVIITTELTETTPTVSGEVTTLDFKASNRLSNPKTYSNVKPKFENKARNNLPNKGILTNHYEVPRSYDHETNSFRSNRVCKKKNAFVAIRGTFIFYVECQNYQPVIKICPGEYNFNLKIMWPEYPCTKIFDENKVFWLVKPHQNFRTM